MKKTAGGSLRTLLTIVVGFTALSLLKNMHGLIYIALAVGTAGLLSARLCSLIEIAWMKLARVLSYIVPNILLTLIFFLVLFPLSLLSRIFKKNDPLLLSNTASSTFINANKTFSRQSFEKPW